MNIFVFFLNVGFCALNMFLYVTLGHAYSLGMAVLSGFGALAVLAMELGP